MRKQQQEKEKLLDHILDNDRRPVVQPAAPKPTMPTKRQKSLSPKPKQVKRKKQKSPEKQMVEHQKAEDKEAVTKRFDWHKFTQRGERKKNRRVLERFQKGREENWSHVQEIQNLIIYIDLFSWFI